MSASRPDAASATSASQTPLPNPQLNTSALQSSAAVASTNAEVATMTITETAQIPPVEDEILQLSLRGRQSVTWDEEVINNEGLGRKSSKRCCIFHKQRAFGESSTDSSESELDGSDSSSTSGDENDQKREGKLKRNKKIAGPKKGKKAPDSQRYHA